MDERVRNYRRKRLERALENLGEVPRPKTVPYKENKFDYNDDFML